MDLPVSYDVRMLESEGDLQQVVGIHRKAFPGSLLSNFSDKVIRNYYELQMISPNECYPVGVFRDVFLEGFCFGGVFRDIKAAFVKNNLLDLLRCFIKKPWLLRNAAIRHRITYIIKYIRKQKRNKNLTSGTLAKKKRSFGILSIAVDPDLQRAGLGKILMDECERIALQHNFTAMRLSVNTENKKAIPFYESLGWMKVNDPDGMWRGHMEKDLSTGL